ncbi:uncharacterized protein TRIADDRAFT_36902 [Trichoplax adhaerens]|uniref:Counting factor associated protein D n=1 Tax=Trichoplax adhaerens TaxID=10228 RepID=B3RJ92_TRIAD|nr:hypothetical protein TRIADDRAFT_36902 [Trichoplax adhaerens]EDV28492.1 hypothetical protein TRIADDRAFT_36902 [Trichoplax adhaerens]|eukprot:XP_002107694.1 hypothetical protein TRIADDRAFT_36902 [Trichoplax adhaerens]
MMKASLLILLFVSVELLAALPASNGGPKWASSYSVQGTLYLPYAKIVEPFKAYFSANKSRIEYYNGMDIVLQRSDMMAHGAKYELVPETTEKFTNVRQCFSIKGSKAAPVTPQAILPDLSKFSKTGTKTYNKIKCDVWTYKNKQMGRVNTYTMYVTQGSKPSPVHYIMEGYDSLLGSHYDEYKLDYKNYKAGKIADNMFDPPKKMKCHGFPGPGLEADMISSPMQQFIDHEAEDTIPRIFHHFASKHQKNYKDERERRFRENTFRQNLRFIHSTNRQRLGFTVKVNHLADLTDNEIKVMNGRKTSLKKSKTYQMPFNLTGLERYVAPTIDWRKLGAVTPVKDQGVCGSCWSFGTTGTIEGSLYLKSGKLVSLSQQNMIDCTWGFGNNGCDGGEEFRAFEWIAKHGGIATEKSYGQYLAQDGKCKLNKTKIGAKIRGWVQVPHGNQSALKLAVSAVGPVAVGMDAALKSFSFYSSGIYYDKQCGNKEQDLDHAVLAVGYGNENGQDYWIIKNSWSTHWGDDGYVKLSMKNNNCGIATDASFVNIM